MSFEFAREEKYPTHYDDNKTAAHIDILTSGLIAAFTILAISLIVILPAYSVTRRKLLFLQITVSLFIGGVVLLGNYGHDWEVGEVEMSSPYKPGSAEEIAGYVSIHVSLRGINITLKGKSIHEDESAKSEEYSELANEKIDYNERFSWEWAQGRLGFGYYAGQISKDFRAAVIRGVPLPILQLAEYFTFDGEGIRFGRYYRTAGWYSHILMWCAFGTWIISNILFSMVVSKGAMFLVFTGLLQLTAIFVWTCLRNPIEIQVPFQSPSTHHDVILRTHFGADYYTVLFNGIFCVIIGLIIFCLNAFISDELCDFFGIDPLTIYDERVEHSKPQTVPIQDDPEPDVHICMHILDFGVHAYRCSGNKQLDDVETGQILRRQKVPKISLEGDMYDESAESHSTLVKRDTNLGRFIQKSFRIKNKKIGTGIADRMEMLSREPLISKEPTVSMSSAGGSNQRRYDSIDENRTSDLPHPPSFLFQ